MMDVTALLGELAKRQVLLRVSPDGQRLSYDCPKGAMTPELLEQIKAHKAELIATLRFQETPSGDANTPDGINREVGRKLLYALWDAGYALRLVPSTRPAGWTIVPIGEATPSGDLLKLFDENHDAAVALLLEACRTAQCRPEDWPPLHLLYAATKYDGGGVSEL